MKERCGATHKLNLSVGETGYFWANQIILMVAKCNSVLTQVNNALELPVLHFVFDLVWYLEH